MAIIMVLLVLPKCALKTGARNNMVADRDVLSTECTISAQ
jgi:hypothetical protein